MDLWRKQRDGERWSGGHVNATRIIFRLFVVVGLVLIAVAATVIQHTRNSLAHSIAVPGVVIANDWSGLNVYFPRVRFETQEGRQIVFRSNAGSRPPAYAVNERELASANGGW
jgi:hypothetical protein